MTAALALDTDGLQKTSGIPAEPVLRQAATFLADLVKQGIPCPPEALDTDEADGWARRFYRAWVDGLSPEEHSALEEYKREGFRGLNRGLRDHDGDLSMLPTEDRRRAAGLDAALGKAPPLEGPVVVHRGRLPDAVLEAFEAGEEETLVGQVFGDPAYTSTSLCRAIARGTAGAPASRKASGGSRYRGGRRPAARTPSSTRASRSCSCPAMPGSGSTTRTARVESTGSRACSCHNERRTILEGALDEKREGRPDDESRAGRFGWPEGAGLRYYDEDGNRISKEEWRELGRREAERSRRAKSSG